MANPPRVGSRAPDFGLTDTRGEKVRLSAFHGRQNVLLVFNRGFL